MRRLAAVAALVAAASAVVAIGATGAGLLLPAANLSAGWTLAVRLVGAAAVVAGAAGLLSQRKRFHSNTDRHYDPTAAAVVAAAAIMGVLALIARLAPADNVADDSAHADSVYAEGVVVEDDENEPTTDQAGPAYGGISGGLGLAREGTDRRTPQEPEDPDDEGLDRDALRRAGGFILLAVLLAVAVLGVLAFTGRLRGRPRDPPPPDAQVVAEDAEAALEASLVDIAYQGRDPRRQITGAYHRLMSALAAAGAPRRPQEAPHEHLHRTLAPLGVQPEPMHALTELYVVAQFGGRAIKEEDRAAANAALEAALLSLRSTKAAAEADRTSAVAGVAARTHA